MITVWAWMTCLWRFRHCYFRPLIKPKVDSAQYVRVLPLDDHICRHLHVLLVIWVVLRPLSGHLVGSFAGVTTKKDDMYTRGPLYHKEGQTYRAQIES